jgi:hypothetical protein
VSEVWSLPGYDVQALLGFGGTGEVWRARELATGEVVALKRLRAGADPSALAALRREATVLRSLDTPYVVRLRAVLGEGDDPVLVLDHAGGGSLAALLARRGSLDPGEVVTVAGPLAQALAAAHARGLVHGDLSPSNVLFSSEGMPLLTDLGLARLADDGAQASAGTAEYLDPAVAAGGAPTPASDVWSLAAVCHHMLAGSPPHEGDGVGDVLTAARSGSRAPLGLLAPSAPRPLVEAVERALDPDPSARPDAAAFAGLVRRAHAAAPVRLTGAPAAGPVPVVRETHAVPRHGAPSPQPADGRRRPRWLAPVLAAAVLLAAAAGLGWWLGRGDDAPAAAAVLPAASASPSPSTTASASPTATAPDWAAVLEELDAVRARAFASGDLGLLAQVYAPGAAGLAADTSLLQELTSAGRTASGVRHQVRSVEEREIGTDRVRLRVVDVLAGYEVRAADGGVVTRTPARGEAPYDVELARTSDGWRLVEVRPL